ncbi:hypothetical protein H5410_012835 [Solanum commersonii]|uniref:Uncharacterized protein n=1 Tax=Solanum commersonii TaxID=4109 RepID=A0A9J6ATG5_SOLCO|nr:hypothetical protein H5410_012835 [Solanum commersonii]
MAVYICGTSSCNDVVRCCFNWIVDSGATNHMVSSKTLLNRGSTNALQNSVIMPSNFMDDETDMVLDSPIVENQSEVVLDYTKCTERLTHHTRWFPSGDTTQTVLIIIVFQGHINAALPILQWKLNQSIRKKKGLTTQKSTYCPFTIYDKNYKGTNSPTTDSKPLQSKTRLYSY